MIRISNKPSSKFSPFSVVLRFYYYRTRVRGMTGRIMKNLAVRLSLSDRELLDEKIGLYYGFICAVKANPFSPHTYIVFEK